MITIFFIRSSSDHAVLSLVYKTYKSFLAVEIDDILMQIENIIWFERLTQGFDNIFYHTFQEGSKLKLLNINIIQSKYGIIIYQTYHTMKNIIQWYWGTKIKDEVKFQKSPFPVDISFGNTLFMASNIIVEEPEKFKNHMEYH